jgi:hypothetical protein
MPQKIRMYLISIALARIANSHIQVELELNVIISHFF